MSQAHTTHELTPRCGCDWRRERRPVRPSEAGRERADAGEAPVTGGFSSCRFEEGSGVDSREGVEDVFKILTNGG